MKGVGAYFAYVAHPFDMPADELAKALVGESGVLLLPATMFVPEGDASGNSHLRIAFANLDRDGIEQMFKRLASVSF